MPERKRRLWTAAGVLFLSLLLLGGCGGGGEGIPDDPGHDPEEPVAEELTGVVNEGLLPASEGGAVVVLDGSKHAGTAYLWAVTSRPEGSAWKIDDEAAATTDFCGDTAGAYKIVLDVTAADGSSREYPYIVTLSVNDDPEKMPVADVRALSLQGATVPEGGLPGVDTTLYLDGRASRGITYLWTVTGFSAPTVSTADEALPVLTAPTSPVTGFHSDEAGVYTVTLKVGNGMGQSAVASVDVTLIDDLDGDGRPDGDDPDRDGDGFVNDDDAFPDDRASHLKWAGRLSTEGNYYVLDEDGDGRGDIDDDEPFDANLTDYPVHDEAETDGNSNDGISVAEGRGAPLVVPHRLAGKIDSSGGRADMDYFALSFSEAGTYSAVLTRADGTDWDPTIALIVADGASLTAAEVEGGVGQTASTFVVASDDLTAYLIVTDGTGGSDPSWTYSVAIFRDSDSDGVSDEREDALDSNRYNADSDGDGVPDLVEIAPVLKDWRLADVDGDGLPAWWDHDSDGDGIPDSVEYLSAREGADRGMTKVAIDAWNDADGDGYPNFLDEDSDNAAVTVTLSGRGKGAKLVRGDAAEAGSLPPKPVDSDGDGRPDFMDGDNDNDGLLDENEVDGAASVTALEFSEEADLFTFLNETKGVENVAAGGDRIRLSGRGLPSEATSAWIVLVGPDAHNPINLRPDEASDGDLLFDWPEGIEAGTVTLFVVVGASRTNALSPLAVAGDSPILTGVLSDSSGRAIFRGLNLNRNFTVCFNGAQTTYDNRWGSATEFTAWVSGDARSGPVYLSSEGVDSNALWLQITGIVTGRVTMPTGSALDVTELVVDWNSLEEARPGADGAFSIPVSMTAPTIVTAFYVRGQDDYVTFLQGLILAGEASVAVDGGGTALAMVWAALMPEELVAAGDLEALRDRLVALDEVRALAALLEAKLAADPSVLRGEDDAIATALNAAMEAAAAVVQGDFLAAGRARSVRLRAEGATITPAEVDDISVYEIAGKGNVGVENDSLLYLSAQVTTADGKVVRSHSSAVSDMIGPQGYGLLFIASTQDFDVPGYRNGVVQVMTGGVDKAYDPKTNARPFDVWKWLYIRSVVEKILFPPIASLIGLGYDPSFWPNLFLSYTPNIVDMALQGNVKGAVSSALATLKADALSAPPGPIMTAIAKKYGPGLAEAALKKFAAKVAAKFIPIVGQLSLALDIAGHVSNGVTASSAVADIVTTDSVIDFTVEFPVQIDEVRPAKLKPDGSNVNFAVVGKGFGPIVRGWWPLRSTLEPKVIFTDVKGNAWRGDPKWIAEDGRRLGIAVPGWWLERAKEYAEDGDGDTVDVTVHHPTDEAGAKYVKDDAVTIVTDVTLASIDPAKGPAGAKAVVYGAGFSAVAGDNEITVGGRKALITAGAETSLSIVVPAGLDPDVYDVRARSRFDGQWSDWTDDDVTYEVVEGEISVTVTDIGGAKDDAFALYVDGRYIGTMYATVGSYSQTWKLSLSPGSHTAMLVGIEAPDSIGTYSISFSGVTGLAGDATSGSDLVPGVRKHYTFTVPEPTESGSAPSMRAFPYVPPRYDAEASLR